MTLEEKLERPTGTLLYCKEEDGSYRKYWPKHSAETLYHSLLLGDTAEFATPEGQQESSSSAAAPLQDSQSARSGLLSLVARGRQAFSSGASGSWKLESGRWKDQQRAITRGAPSSPAAENGGPEDGEPPVEFLSGPEMFPAVMRGIGNMQQSFYAMQYILDHTDVVIQLALKLKDGVVGRVIFDRGNFLDSSAARQAPRVKDLWDVGCQMRMLKPRGGNFASMHAKTIVFDEQVLFSGSVNLSHNGLENNTEHLFKIAEPVTVAKLLTSFEETWERAEPVEQHHIDKMLATRERKDAHKYTRSRSHSVSRSLSVELEDAK